MKLFILFEFMGNMLFFIFLGYLADRYWLSEQQSPSSWGLLAGILLGFSYALYSLMRQLKK